MTNSQSAHKVTYQEKVHKNQNRNMSSKEMINQHKDNHSPSNLTKNNLKKEILIKYRQKMCQSSNLTCTLKLTINQ